MRLPVLQRRPPVLRSSSQKHPVWSWSDVRKCYRHLPDQNVLPHVLYVFCSFLQMNMISKENVKNYTAHACDYYQVTAQLDIG